MIRNLLLTALTGAAMTAVAAPADNQARLLRFPATNGQEIVFSYAGDLYTVPATGGEARRLTSHVGYEIFPRFSPDGKTIAFTGQYDGNTEVFSIPAHGGEPVRLTYSPTNSRDDIGDRMGPNNIVVTWSPDGKKILYRNRIGDGFQGALYTVSPDGGMPDKLPLPEGGFASYSPDGTKLAYNRVMREFRNWKYYRGGMADDIWIYDPKAGSVTNITDNPAQDIVPMWIGDEIFFISDRDMTMNLFAYNTATGKTEKVTDFTEYDIKFPSSDGHTIVFENGGYIYRFDPATRKAQQVPVTLNGENLYARQERIDVSDLITAIDLSPDGKRVVATARGEVFDVPAGKGVTRNLTRTPGSNDRSATWSPDGSTIAYISDITGETEVWTIPAGGGEPRQLTDGSDTYIRSIEWSPDSKRILYTDRKNRMVSVDPVSGKKTLLAQDSVSEFRGVAFSPDSRWIAYTRPAENDMAVVYLMELATGREIPVTEKWYNSMSPVFSADGKYLFFNSARDFSPTYGSLEWNHVYNDLYAPYMVMLSADTPSPLLPGDSETYPDQKDEKSEAPVSVSVTPEGLADRIVKLPLGYGYRRVIYSDGKKVYFTGGEPGINTYDFATGKKDNVTSARLQALTADGKKAIVAEKGNYYVINFPGKPGDTVDLSGMIATVDYPREWAQIFDETWRAFRDGFYLENMHGVDWNAVKTKYAALLPYVKTRLDLNYVIGAMISELACGHAYVNPGPVPRPERIPMGLLGADLSRDKSGYFRIDAILEGAPYSSELRAPLAQHGLGVKSGDYIVAVDGTPVTTVDNIYKLLVGKAGRATELTVNSAPSDKGARKIVVTPTANEYPLRHYAWVQRNIHLVDSLSGGKVGYIYIPDMGPEGLNEFARYFYPQLDKEALIIDDRANGGGNVSPMIIERLLRQPYRMTMRRNSTRTGTIPDATHVGPKVLLINKYSASDGDLFPWSFKANNLGTVIGTRTWGGIVGISGSLPYMDGTDVRVPFFTNYDAKTGQWIVENHGVDPDILIDNDPVSENAGHDQQLEAAIKVALEQLKDRKPMPKIPAPRTFKDLSL